LSVEEEETTLGHHFVCLSYFILVVFASETSRNFCAYIVKEFRNLLLTKNNVLEAVTVFLKAVSFGCVVLSVRLT